MSGITDAGPYLCIQKLRNASRTVEKSEVGRRITVAIDETETTIKELLDKIKRLEQRDGDKHA